MPFKPLTIWTPLSQFLALGKKRISQITNERKSNKKHKTNLRFEILLLSRAILYTRTTMEPKCIWEQTTLPGSKIPTGKILHDKMLLWKTTMIKQNNVKMFIKLVNHKPFDISLFHNLLVRLQFKYFCFYHVYYDNQQHMYNVCIRMCVHFYGDTFM